MDKNMRRITFGKYLVRTQAGFKKAIKHFDPDVTLDREEYTFNYPEKYPSVVSFYEYYCGCHFLGCNSVPLNEYKERLKKALMELENE